MVNISMVNDMIPKLLMLIVQLLNAQSIHFKMTRFHENISTNCSSCLMKNGSNDSFVFATIAAIGCKLTCIQIS